MGKCSECGGNMSQGTIIHEFRKNGNFAEGEMRGIFCDSCEHGIIDSGQYMEDERIAFRNKSIYGDEIDQSEYQDVLGFQPKR